MAAKRNMARGITFKHQGLTWKILEVSEKGCLCIAEETKEMKFDAATNNWEKSELRAFLNGEFAEKCLKEAEIIKRRTEMKSLDGRTYGSCEDAVRVLTLEEYRTNRDLFPEINDPGANFFWLATPWTTAGNMVCVVTPVGTIEGMYCENKIGIRPVCFFSAEHFK